MVIIIGVFGDYFLIFIIFFYFFYIQKPHPLHIIKDYYFSICISWVSFTVSTVPLYALRPAGTVKRNRRCSGTGAEGEKSREDRGNRLIIQTASLSPSFTVHYHPRQPQASEREAGR